MTTKIEWTDETWNPITGCTPISTGCANCYAARMAKRLQGRFGYDADDPFKVTLHEDKLDQPLNWRKSRRVFVCSMGDLFHQDVPDAWINEVWLTMHAAHWHLYQVLTKRPERMREWVTRWQGDHDTVAPNIWLGVTAENQEQADKRIPHLLATPAAVRFVSIEPMLGRVDLTAVARDRYLFAKPWNVLEQHDEPTDHNVFDRYPALDWVIVGGETGPGARRMDPEWAVAIKDQCQQSGISFFYKGAGTASLPKTSPYYRMLDGRTWEQFPKALP